MNIQFYVGSFATDLLDKSALQLLCVCVEYCGITCGKNPLIPGW